MANMVYANPFGAMLEGKRAALDDTLKLREAQNKQEYLKWYMPFAKQEAARQAYKSDLALKQAAMQRAAIEYKATSNPASLLKAAVDIGMDASVINSIRNEDQLNLLAEGAFNGAFAVDPNTYFANGMQREGPSSKQQQPLSLEEQIANYEKIHGLSGGNTIDNSPDVWGNWGGTPMATPSAVPTPHAATPTATPTREEVNAANARQQTLYGNQHLTTPPTPMTPMGAAFRQWLGIGGPEAAPAPVPTPGNSRVIGHTTVTTPRMGTAENPLPYNVATPMPDYSGSGYDPTQGKYDPTQVQVP